MWLSSRTNLWRNQVRPELKRFYTSFAKAVLTAREGLGITQMQVAAAIGVDGPTLGKLERNAELSVSLHTGLGLIKHLGLEEEGGIWRVSPELLRTARRSTLERQQAEIAAQLAALDAL